MKIEVVEFYKAFKPKGKKFKGNKNLLGSMHFFIEDWGVDLRGVAVIRIRDGFYFQLPQAKGWDFDKKKPCKYPFLNFADHSKHLAFVDELRKVGTEYLRENVL